MESFQEAFNNFDRDKNGFITKKEIKKVVKKCGSKIKTKDIEKMVGSFGKCILVKILKFRLKALTLIMMVR